MYAGDFAIESSFDIKFTTIASTGAPITLAGTPVISIYPGNSTTELTAGITLTVDFDARTGLHNIRVVATVANGYAAATNYAIVITTGTVDGVSVVGYVVAHFSLDNRSALRPTTAGRTLDVSAGGEAGVDWANVGTPGSTVSLSATTVATVTTTTTATNVTTVNGLAANVITAASIAADAITDAKVAADVTIASVTGAVGSVTGAVGSVTGAVGSVTGAVGSVTGNVGGNVVGSVGSVAAGGIAAAAFAVDAITAAALAPDAGTEIGTAVWASAARTLTAATNITSTGGTTVPQTGDSFARIGAAGAGLTAVPWNAAWDAEVQSEVDDAIAARFTFTVAGSCDANVQLVNDVVVNGVGSAANPWGP